MKRTVRWGPADTAIVHPKESTDHTEAERREVKWCHYLIKYASFDYSVIDKTSA
jgi:hypothetical protein